MTESSHQLPQTVESIGVALAEAAMRLTRCPTLVVVRDPATQEASIVAASVGTDRRLLGMTIGADSAAGRACVSNVTREASGLQDLLGSPGDDRRHRESEGVAFAVCEAGRSIGALVVLAPLQMIDDSTQDRLLTLIDEAGQLMGQQVAERFAREVGLIDAITGNPNRPALEKAMRESIIRRCSLVCMAVDEVSALDIDRGNAVLRQVASLLRNNLRGYDVAARTGGEEFALFLPGAGLDNAVIVADRVRSAVVEWHFDLDRERALTCSLGVASIPDTVSEVDNLMEAANGARVEARASGPNSIATLH